MNRFFFLDDELLEVENRALKNQVRDCQNFQRKHFRKEHSLSDSDMHRLFMTDEERDRQIKSQVNDIKLDLFQGLRVVLPSLADGGAVSLLLVKRGINHEIDDDESDLPPDWDAPYLYTNGLWKCSIRLASTGEILDVKSEDMGAIPQFCERVRVCDDGTLFYQTREKALFATLWWAMTSKAHVSEKKAWLENVCKVGQTDTMRIVIGEGDEVGFLHQYKNNGCLDRVVFTKSSNPADGEGVIIYEQEED